MIIMILKWARHCSGPFLMISCRQYDIIRKKFEASVVCVGSSTARESRMKFRAGEHDHSYSAPPVISGFPCVIVSIAEGQRCYHGQKKAPCLKIRRREKTV